MAKKIVILGSTGSIGASTLEVLKNLHGDFHVVGLAAGKQWQLLAQQALRCKAQRVAIGDESLVAPLRDALGKETRILGGTDGLVELVETSDCDIVVSAIVGIAGLMATVRAIELGKRVAIANKETLVVAGPLIMELADRHGAELIPIDSEHSAIFQAMHSGLHDELHKIFLTSSGGPFRNWTLDDLQNATLEDALSHPVWSMGPKITIDSATMMNKALEIVEARWLFGVPPSKIEVLIHPEAVVHSLVEFRDGCLIAQLGSPDMRTPIQYALTYPQRHPGCGTPLDLTSIRTLHFESPDESRFPGLRLGFEVAEMGGTSGAVLNAANEAAVDAFRRRQIGFREISDLVSDILKNHRFNKSPTLKELIEIDAWARQEVSGCLKC